MSTSTRKSTRRVTAASSSAPSMPPRAPQNVSGFRSAKDPGYHDEALALDDPGWRKRTNDVYEESNGPAACLVRELLFQLYPPANRSPPADLYDFDPSCLIVGDGMTPCFELDISDTVVDFRFTMKLGRTKSHWEFRIGTTWDDPTRRLWLGPLMAEQASYELSTMDVAEAPIVEALKFAVAKIAATATKSSAQRTLKYCHEIISAHVERPVWRLQLKMNPEGTINIASKELMRTVTPADVGYPLNPSCCVPEYSMPEDWDAAIASLLNPILEFTVARSFNSTFTNLKLREAVVKTLKFMLLDGEDQWKANVNRYFLTSKKEAPLFKATKTHVIVHVSRSVWGASGAAVKPSMGHRHLSMLRADPEVIKQIAAVGNDVHRCTENAPLAVKVVAIIIDANRPPTLLQTRAETVCASTLHSGPCPEPTIHTCCVCGVKGPCSSFLVSYRTCFCLGKCVIQNYQLPPIVDAFGSPFRRSIKEGINHDKLRGVATNDELATLLAAPHLQPLNSVQMVAAVKKLNSQADAQQADEELLTLLKVRGYELLPHHPPCTFRKGYQPVRCYMVNTGKEQPADDIPPHLGAGFSVNWIRQYQEYYSRQIIYDSYLEHLPLRPSLERKHLVDIDGTAGHSRSNSVVSCAGFNMLHGAYDPAIPRLLPPLRAGEALVRTNLPPQLTEAWERMVDNVAGVIDRLSANLLAIPYRNEDRWKIPLNEVAAIYTHGEELVAPLGLALPTLDPEWYPKAEGTAPPVYSSPEYVSSLPPAAHPSEDEVKLRFAIREGSGADRARRKVWDSIEAVKADPTLPAQYARSQGDYYSSRAVFQKDYNDQEDDGKEDDENGAETEDRLEWRPKGAIFDDLRDLEGDLEGVDGDLEDAEGDLVDDRVDLAFNTVDIGALREVVEVIAGKVQTILSDPKSRYYGCFTYSAEYVKTITERGDIFLPEMYAITQQVKLKWKLLLVLILHCDRLGWHLIVCITSFLVMNCFWRIMTRGRDHLFGFLLRGSRSRSRNPLQLSEGHIIHGLNMFHAYINHLWGGLATDPQLHGFDFEKLNVITESWASNLYRLNYSRLALVCWDLFVIRAGLKDLDVLVEHQPDQDLKRWWKSEGRALAHAKMATFRIDKALKYLFPVSQ